MKKIFTILTILMFWSMGVLAVGSFPFPQNVDYDYGILPTNRNSAKIQTYYEKWKTEFYAENGNEARIRFDDRNYTVSEGIGYGMLIFVYMDNAKNDTQDEFDKLWNYYKKWENNNGLMNWKIKGFTSVEGGNGATDGDLDVALSLLLAHKQWGSNGTVNYIAEAETLMAAIYDHETTNNFLKPGDAWQDKANPCYFTLAGLKLFDIAQNSEGFNKTRDWASVYSTAVSYLQNSQWSNGLWPDWTTFTVNSPSSLGNYYWDACRTPWRIAWDYLWFGNDDSKSMCAKSVAFLKNKSLLSNPGSVHSGYNEQSGEYSSDGSGNMAYVGPFAVALMTDDTYQSNLNTYYNYMCNSQAEFQWGYYAPILQILCMLNLSGNMPNFYASGAATAPRLVSAANDATNPSNIVLTFNQKLASVASTAKSSFTVKIDGVKATISSISASGSSITLKLSDATKAGEVITVSYSGTSVKSADDVEIEAFSNSSVKNNLVDGFILSSCENDNLTELGTAWYSFNDNADGGKSTISQLTTEKTLFEMSQPGAAGSANAAMVKIKLNHGKLTYDGYAGMGFALDEDENAYDLSAGTGISFWHKGMACKFEINTSDITNDQNYTAKIDAHTNWTLVELSWKNTSTKGVAGDFAQEDWGTNGKLVSFNPAHIVKMQWKPQGADMSSAEELWIDEVAVAGMSSTPSINKTALIALQATAEKELAKANNNTGFEPGNYGVSETSALKKAISATEAILTSAKTQDEINAQTKNLQTAIDKFKKSIVGPADNSELLATIASAKEILHQAQYKITDDIYWGWTQKVYDKFEDYIEEAEIIANNSSSSQSTIDKANSELLDNIEWFKNSEKHGIVQKDNLLSLINDANSKKKSATIGTTAGTYPQSAVNALSSAISAAQTVYDNSSATADDVSFAEADLQNAISNFLSSENAETNKAKLLALIADAEEQAESATIGTTAGTYTQNSVDALNSAIDVAQKVADNISATEAQVSAAESTLQSAIDSFIASVNTDVPENPRTQIDENNNVEFVNCISSISVKANQEIENVKIVNLLGSLIFAENINSNQAEISISVLPNGVYLAIIQFANGNCKTAKFVKH